MHAGGWGRDSYSVGMTPRPGGRTNRGREGALGSDLGGPCPVSIGASRLLRAQIDLAAAWNQSRSSTAWRSERRPSRLHPR